MAATSSSSGSGVRGKTRDSALRRVGRDVRVPVPVPVRAQPLSSDVPQLIASFSLEANTRMSIAYSQSPSLDFHIAFFSLQLGKYTVHGMCAGIAGCMHVDVGTQSTSITHANSVNVVPTSPGLGRRNTHPLGILPIKGADLMGMVEHWSADAVSFGVCDVARCSVCSSSSRGGRRSSSVGISRYSVVGT